MARIVNKQSAGGGVGPARELRVVARHLEKGRLDKALSLVETVIESHPVSAEALTQMGTVLEAMGRPREAMAQYGRACALAPGDARPLFKYASLARWSRETAYSPEILAAFEACFVESHSPPLNAPEASARDVARLMGAQLAARHRLHDVCLACYRDGRTDDEALAARIEEVAADRLFGVYLENYVNVNADIEYLLTLARRRWLLDGAGVAGTDRSAFLASLAVQCATNEYVWRQAEDEESAVAKWHARLSAWPIEDGGNREAQLEALLLYALYRPVHRLANAAKLRVDSVHWPAPMQHFAKIALKEPLREKEIQAEMPRLTAIAADSEAVQGQYEANPYPRWHHHRAPERESFAAFIRRHFPHQRLPWLGKRAKRALVAGCGTGREAINLALSFPDLDVLAVDLSTSSLAYGRRKAEELGLDRITFQQADLLKLAAFDQRFEFISCQGVLHHLGDPGAGLAVLAELLAPQGLMRMGLYSERGRDIVIRARQHIADAGLSPRPADMRRFRTEVLCQPENHPLRDLVVGGNDFYCLSGLRDFLFHVREHRYQPVELKELLDQQDLAFLGFELAHAGKRRLYRAEFPQDSPMRDLDLWEQFESAHPHMVEGLYRFWCAKADVVWR